MSIEPRYLSADMDNAPIHLVDDEYRLQESLRVMSSDPHEPRIFSQERIFVPVFLSLGSGMTWAMVSMLLSDSEGVKDSIAGWLYLTLFLGTPYLLLSHGLWRRFGVDHDKVWTRFGHLFYRQVRFNDITRIGVGIERYKIWAGKTKINIDYHRFDYALFYLRLLEELHHRRIHLPKANINDPDWDEEAQIWRNGLAEDIWVAHRDFYDTHPEQLARLNALTPPPDHYDD